MLTAVINTNQISVSWHNRNICLAPEIVQYGWFSPISDSSADSGYKNHVPYNLWFNYPFNLRLLRKQWTIGNIEDEDSLLTS